MPRTKKESQSRPARWGRACSEGIAATQSRDVESARDAMAVLDEIREEYQSWLDNLPEAFQSSPLADKLNDVTSLDLDFSLVNAAEEAEDKWVTRQEENDTPDAEKTKKPAPKPGAEEPASDDELEEAADEAWNELEGVFSEAEGADLPLGFGRD